MSEILFLVSQVGFERSDVMLMPTFERKYHINQYLKWKKKD